MPSTGEHRHLASLHPLAALALMATSAACGGAPATNVGAGGSGTTTTTTTSTNSGSGGTGGTPGTGGTGGGLQPAGAIAFLNLNGYPADITPDGRTVLLQTLDTGDIFFYDTVTKALDHKTNIGDPGTDSAGGISQTLRVVASKDVPVMAGIWSEGTGWLEVGSTSSGCDSFVGDGWDISADGKIAVGMVWNGCQPQAFRWTDTGGQGMLTLLQRLGTGLNGKPPSNRATKVADDGSVIGGFAENYPNDRTPAAWRADGSGFLLDPKNTGIGEVLAISADGSILGGYLSDNVSFNAFTWTEGGGFVTLERPQGIDVSYKGLVNSVVAKGNLVFGRFGDIPQGQNPVAFVWTPGAKTRALPDVIANAGVVIPPEYTLWNVTAASTDGSVVVGTAQSSASVFVPWVLTMPVSSYGP
jgi:hypothetical protein